MRVSSELDGLLAAVTPPTGWGPSVLVLNILLEIPAMIHAWLHHTPPEIGRVIAFILVFLRLRLRIVFFFLANVVADGVSTIASAWGLAHHVLAVGDVDLAHAVLPGMREVVDKSHVAQQVPLSYSVGRRSSDPGA